jgi:hypothetical protein
MGGEDRTVSNEYVIIGIDPGLMTGLFAYYNTVRLGTTSPVDHWNWPEQFSADIAPFKLSEYLNEAAEMFSNASVHIAIERYIITPKTAKLSQQTEALEVTGTVKAIAALHGVSNVRQYAKANLKFASDDMLKAVGWSTPGMRHANDAARQAFALLKDVDYPRWSELVRDAKMEPTTEG